MPRPALRPVDPHGYAVEMGHTGQGFDFGRIRRGQQVHVGPAWPSASRGSCRARRESRPRASAAGRTTRARSVRRTARSPAVTSRRPRRPAGRGCPSPRSARRAGRPPACRAVPGTSRCARTRPRFPPSPGHGPARVRHRPPRTCAARIDHDDPSTAPYDLPHPVRDPLLNGPIVSIRFRAVRRAWPVAARGKSPYSRPDRRWCTRSWEGR